MLLCSNGSFYVGQSRDVGRRLKRHADGTGARQTRQLKEFQLVYVEGPLHLEAAVQRERQLKKWSRAKKMALARGDHAELKQLSESRDNP
ncbi:MAG: GIY-YIG nuclease family protein [Opitutales bacterium]|nr:GIY-YIG nuclease family protein [Opitutales bacterium]